MPPIKRLLLAAIAVSALQPALADEKPPPGAMALSTVLTKLEQLGYTPIIAVTLENGHWEVEAYKGSEKRELEVNPNTAEILTDEPDDD
ncbi:Peptidase propeptide and YPEB domain-containing protein [Microbulbifer donghaiensis]|uniref:Peptidase propeptide and YPEB domain-containing protein n=1 Tax=Microbulbifer donghaiensis TaxID=494016 RepID=A0A1M5FZC2_9GAMM|nr:PepSY domain-containing protein [Microbulbifer donghaiensis]SHF96541.1 Peptidase propeptide and YPEB domain-containing protein [Microbulbifer donghaiensis]